MTLKLLGVGFGRTGTSSIKAALEMLGWGPCHHMHEVRDHPEQLSLWAKAARGGRVDWDQAFAGYASQIDWPGARYWRELADHFPGARILLTVRDADEWYKSLSQTILPSAAIGRQSDPNLQMRAFADMVYQTIHEGVFKGRIGDRDYAIAAYHEHIRKVQSVIPPDRLLTYDVKEGWGPLCAFLGVAQPDRPFPHRNTRDEFLRTKGFMKQNHPRSQG